MTPLLLLSDVNRNFHLEEKGGFEENYSLAGQEEVSRISCNERGEEWLVSVTPSFTQTLFNL